MDQLGAMARVHLLPAAKRAIAARGAAGLKDTTDTKNIVEAASRYTPRNTPAIVAGAAVGTAFGYGTASLTARRKFQVKKQGPPVRIKSLQEWLDHLLDAQP
jgi:hypothetical protein